MLGCPGHLSPLHHSETLHHCHCYCLGDNKPCKQCKGMYMLMNELLETIRIINVAAAFVLDYKYSEKLSEHSLDSLSRAQGFFPVLEVQPSLLLLPVSMETGPGS